MKKLLIITVLFLCAASLQAAQLYYQFPDATKLKDNDRILVFQNNSGNRNVTGAKLKSEVMGGDGALIKQAPTGSAKYARQVEVRNASGTITMFVTAAGTMVLGTPSALSISAVYPANGATGVASGTYPRVTFSQSVEDVSISNMYIVGSSAAPAGCALSDVNGLCIATTGASWSFPTFVGTPGATYTIKVVRGTITQTEGETANSCGTAMTDIAGVCTSTFTMAP